MDKTEHPEISVPPHETMAFCLHPEYGFVSLIRWDVLGNDDKDLVRDHLKVEHSTVAFFEVYTPPVWISITPSIVISSGFRNADTAIGCAIGIARGREERSGPVATFRAKTSEIGLYSCEAVDFVKRLTDSDVDMGKILEEVSIPEKSHRIRLVLKPKKG